MNNRPLLDYLAFPDDHADAVAPGRASASRPENSGPAHADSLEAKLEVLAARLRAKAPPALAAAPEQDLTLSAQIEAILKRKAPQAAEHRAPHAARDVSERQVRRERLAIDPPPTVPTFAASPSVDPEFAKFSEAVYLIGQAARRFVEEPPTATVPARQLAPPAPSTAEIDALSAVLRETVSAFRSVADDLAVSAGEIRKAAMRPAQAGHAGRDAVREDRDGELRDTLTAFQAIARELAASVGDIRTAARNDDRRPAARRDRRDRYRDEEDEIHDLRDTVTDLQDRLDTLLHARRRPRS
jgi:hypothetical protein